MNVKSALVTAGIAILAVAIASRLPVLKSVVNPALGAAS